MKAVCKGQIESKSWRLPKIFAWTPLSSLLPYLPFGLDWRDEASVRKMNEVNRNCNYYLKCTGLNMGPDEALLDWTIGEPLIPITLGLEARMMSFCEISPAANFHLMKVFFQFEILWNVFYFRENSNFLWFQFLSFLSVRWLLDILPKWSSWI